MLETDHTALRVGVRTATGVDLTHRPFSEHRALISSIGTDVEVADVVLMSGSRLGVPNAIADSAPIAGVVHPTDAACPPPDADFASVESFIDPTAAHLNKTEVAGGLSEADFDMFLT